MQSDVIIGGYVGGKLFSWTDEEAVLVANHFNYIVAWEAGVSPEGDISYNFGTVAKNGSYVGPASMQERFELLSRAGGPKTILLSLGAGTGYSSYANMAALGFARNGIVYNNWKAIHEALPMIDGIDFDDEEGLSEANDRVIVEFTKMLKEIGFRQVTFCPYTQKNHWEKIWAAVEHVCPGYVSHFNLQCYSGGAGNDPNHWFPPNATETLVLPGLDATQAPAQILHILNTWQTPSYRLRGAWYWTLDVIDIPQMKAYSEALLYGIAPVTQAA